MKKRNIFISILKIVLTVVSFGVFFVVFFLKKEDKEIIEEKIIPKETKKEIPFTEREKRIFEKIKQTKILTPKELQELLPKVSTRTIRRDMDSLVEKGIVKQEGKTKSTIYKYIGE